jgi:ABC-type uncharacterized transport system ATPase subunit
VGKFKVAYRRLKPAGSIQFDPNLTFSEIMDIPRANTPEEAVLQLSRENPWMTIVSVDRIAGQESTQFNKEILNVSGIAESTQRELKDFLDKNPNLTAETKAILLKSQESFKQIDARVDKLATSVAESRRLRTRIVDWTVAALVGIILTLIVQMVLSWLGYHLPFVG